MEQRVKKHLCRVYGLGMADVDELYELGCHTVASTLSRLKDAFSRSDAQEIADAGHMLKGALFNMGLAEFGEMAKELELAGKAGCVQDARTIFAGLLAALENF